MQGGKRRLPIPVGGQRRQVGVVDPLHHPVVASAAEPGPVDPIAGTHGVQQLHLGRPKARRAVLVVKRCETGLGAHEQPDQPAPLRLALAVRREFIGPALAGKPLAGAFPAHEAGEGLVQGHVIGHPKPLVGDLVDQQFGQLRLRPIDEGAEQRIVEVAERGVGGDPAHIGLQALVGQALRGAAGGILREVAPIGGAAREGMAPLAGRQREGRCGEDVPQHMAALKSGEAPVAAAGVQAHLGFGEPQNLPGPPQPGLERRRGGRVRQQRIDRLRRPQQAPMPTHRLGVVAEVPAAAEGHRQQQHRHVSACCLCVQGSSTNPNPP